MGLVGVAGPRDRTGGECRHPRPDREPRQVQGPRVHARQVPRRGHSDDPARELRRRRPDLGGGGSMAGPAPQSTLNETYPVPPSAWQAEGNTTQGVRTLKAYAVCAGFVPSYENNQSALTENTVLFASASCEPELEPIGGRRRGHRRRHSDHRQLPAPTAEHAPGLDHPGSQHDDERHPLGRLRDLQRPRREAPGTRPGPRRRRGDRQGDRGMQATEAVVSGGWSAKREDVVGYVSGPCSTQAWDSKDDANKVPDDGWLVKAQNLHTQSDRVSRTRSASARRSSRAAEPS